MKQRTKREIQFAVCVNNKKYETSLEAGKLYRIIPDEEAESHGYLRRSAPAAGARPSEGVLLNELLAQLSA
jgi:hypothetical protein